MIKGTPGKTLLAVLVLGLELSVAAQEVAPSVDLMRVPHGGIQPQVAVDENGAVHMIYYKGEPGAGDIYYLRTTDGVRFSEPLRVNTHGGSAIAVGNIRGAHIAVGKNGRAHVAWMGSAESRPRGPENTAPMLYTRMKDGDTGFEEERNVIRQRSGLDGGGSLAADRMGNVFVVWHAPGDGERTEANRTVWLARSNDEGRSFSKEVAISVEGSGACGCCGLRAFQDSAGRLYVLYRSANEIVHRDMYLLASGDGGKRFEARMIHPWTIGQCVMSSSVFAEGPRSVLVAWETDYQVYRASVDPTTFEFSEPTAAPGKGRRKHPVLAVNKAGDVLFAWIEDTGWARGGSLAWQLVDAGGATVEEGSGRSDGVPVWSLISAFPRPDGRFVIVY